MKPSIEGKWRGTYAYKHDARKASLQSAAHVNAFEAEFEVIGVLVTGSIRDLQPESSYPLADELVQNKSLFSDAAYREWAAISARFPEAIIIRGLPESAEVFGQLEGDRLTFVKRYVGETWTVVQLKPGHEKEIERRSGHAVTYEGTVREDRIVGAWRIEGDPNLRTASVDGTFSLERM